MTRRRSRNEEQRGEDSTETIVNLDKFKEVVIGMFECTTHGPS
jgi:hypothetical protein